MLVNSTQRLEADIGPDSDLEGEFLQKRIDYHKSVRQAKPRRSDWTNMLVKREVEHWQKLKIKADSDNALLKCEAKTFKTYLEWHVKTFRIKKESTLQSYWKCVSLAYIDLAGHRMDNSAELDVRDWSPVYLTLTYKLDTSEKEKRAIQIRVQLSLMLLLSGATATRLGALIESSSARGSNKACWVMPS
ncbi:MAG: hypothetical protein M1813_009171 [Trichoglossum hirsutum]|nr:MAG: hypothetical protein M1813_009171 [Trichoglossum hirsutum]